MGNIAWPDGKQFAFTIFDDTDHASVQRLEPVYKMLKDLGFRTTKSVWPIKGDKVAVIGGDTCENPEYLDWVQRLAESGFEIALHNVTFHTSKREDTLRGIEKFNELFGHYPVTLANHSGCKEGIYWGRHRLGGLAQIVYSAANSFKDYKTYRGHLPGDELFWGDICQTKIKYVRNFGFNEINTLKACPQMPYHDPSRPYVNYWFAATEGQTVDSFLRSCNERNIDRLAEEGGASIMYTHLAKGFCESGKIHQGFQNAMDYLNKKNGWFVPVGELLDFILAKRGFHKISLIEKKHLEWKWLSQKLQTGHS